MKFVKFIAAAACAIMACACCGSDNTASWWDEAEAWYDNGEEINPDFVDVFYLYSTCVTSSTDSLGNVSYTAVLTDEERGALDHELHSSNTKIFPDSLNFIAPYYHQYTMDALDLPENEMLAVSENVVGEVNDSFDYYMKNVNGGRRFILAGFSQGAEMALEVLKHMSDEDYEKMVVAYLIGYRVTEEDMECGRIVPATDSFSNGVTVSFNSIANPDAFWDFVNADAAFCTNPVNWTTDSTAADFYFEGETLSVHVDEELNSLIVEGIDIDDYRYEFLEKYAKPGNLHHWDIKFYRPYLRQNALVRAYGN